MVTMQSWIKTAARTVLPERAFLRLLSIHSRNHQLKYLRKTGDLDLASKLVESYGTTILRGPFKGLLYPRAALLDRVAAPLLLGSYEQELHPVFENLSPSYDLYIDIGAGAGHYAAGMARRSAGGKVFAYETDPRELAYCREMARLNGLEQRMEFRSWCSPAELIDSCSGRRAFLLSDCEGYEFELFNEEVVKALRSCDLVIELHDRPGVRMANVLPSRFASTHRTILLSVTERAIDDYPESKVLGKDAQRALADHRLPHQQWLYCQANATP